MLTLPATQITCERVFSKLKIVKNILRSLLGQTLLESLMLINVEFRQNLDIDHDCIIDEIGHSSH